MPTRWRGKNKDYNFLQRQRAIPRLHLSVFSLTRAFTLLCRTTGKYFTVIFRTGGKTTAPWKNFTCVYRFDALQDYRSTTLAMFTAILFASRTHAHRPNKIVKSFQRSTPAGRPSSSSSSEGTRSRALSAVSRRRLLSQFFQRYPQNHVRKCPIFRRTVHRPWCLLC